MSSQFGNHIVGFPMGRLIGCMQQCFAIALCDSRLTIKVEPSHGKTNNFGFRPGPTQANLYSRSSKFLVFEVEGLYYLCSENKDADQLCCNCTADLHLCFHLCILLSFLCGNSVNNALIICIHST